MYSQNDESTVRPKDSLLFYHGDGFKLQLLNEEFPQLLNVPATEYNVNDMVLNIRFPTKVCCFAYSPDGRFLASPWSLFGEKNAGICIWDAYTGTCIGILKTPTLSRIPMSNITFSASGELARTYGRAIDGYNLSTRASIEGKREERYPLEFKDLTFSPDGKQLVAMAYDNIFIWDFSSFEEHLYPLPEDQHPIRAIKLLGDDKIAIASKKGLEIWAWKTEKRVLHKLHDDTWDICSLAFSPERQWLAAGLEKENPGEGTDDSYAIKIWDINSGKLLHTSNDLTYSVSQLSFSFDSKRLAAADGKWHYKIISIWDLERGHFDPLGFELMEYEHTGSGEVFQSMLFSPKDFSLAALFHNINGKKHGEREFWSTIRIWDASAFEDEANKRIIQKKGHTNAICCVKFSHNGKFFATADCDGKICIWDGVTGNHQASFESESNGQGDEIFLLISPDDESLATCSTDGKVTIWDAATGSPRQRLIGHERVVSCAVFSPDGKRLVSASDDKTKCIIIWDLHGSSNTDKIMETPPTRRIEIAEKEAVPTCMAFSPDGTQLACCAGAVKIWKLSPDGSLNNLQQLEDKRNGRRIAFRSIFFSQDAEFIIGSEYDYLSLWKIESKECERKIEVKLRFQSLKWNPDDPQYIFTDLGPYYIGEAFDTKRPKDQKQSFWKDSDFDDDYVRTPPATSPKSVSCTLQKDGSGIHWKGKSLVKFPDRYRPLVWKESLYMASIHGRKVVLGFESGHVTLLNFEGDDTEI